MASRARSRAVIKPDVLVVGIDVAKRRHVAAIRRPDGIKLAPFPFENSRSGFEKLLRRTERAREQLGCRSVLFALEATGHYGHALRQFVSEQGHPVIGINPAHTKRAKELEDNSPEKSDPKDARVIADLAAQGRGRLTVMPRGVYADLRRLGKFRERLVNERVRHCNRYLGLLDLLFPELCNLVRNPACRSIRRLLAECATPGEIASLGFDDLVKKLSSWSRKRISWQKTAEIYRLAGSSIGITEGLDAARFELRHMLSALDRLDIELAEVAQLQKTTLQGVPYADLLLSVPQMGPVSVATILGETGDLRSYRDADAVIKMAGYNLYTVSSGSFRGKTRITKRGRPLLRRHLFLAALRLSKTGAPLNEFHRRLVRHKPRPMVIVGSCRKLLRLMVALVRDGRRFEPGLLGTGKQAA